MSSALASNTKRNCQRKVEEERVVMRVIDCNKVSKKLRHYHDEATSCGYREIYYTDPTI